MLQNESIPRTEIHAMIMLKVVCLWYSSLTLDCLVSLNTALYFHSREDELDVVLAKRRVTCFCFKAKQFYFTSIPNQILTKYNTHCNRHLN